VSEYCCQYKDNNIYDYRKNRASFLLSCSSSILLFKLFFHNSFIVSKKACEWQTSFGGDGEYYFEHHLFGISEVYQDIVCSSLKNYVKRKRTLETGYASRSLVGALWSSMSPIGEPWLLGGRLLIAELLDQNLRSCSPLPVLIGEVWTKNLQHREKNFLLLGLHLGLL
jgi:hypothetical protein